MTTCEHEIEMTGVEDVGNDQSRMAYGKCTKCGQEFEGYATCNGANDDGSPSWAADEKMWEPVKS